MRLVILKFEVQSRKVTCKTYQSLKYEITFLHIEHIYFSSYRLTQRLGRLYSFLYSLIYLYYLYQM